MGSNPVVRAIDSPPRCREVRIVALKSLAAHAVDRGIDPATLCEGLGFSAADLDLPFKQIDWEDFVVFVERFVGACGGPHEFERFLTDRVVALHSLIALVGLSISPRAMYLEMAPWICAHCYSALEFSAEQLAGGRIHWRCSVRPEYSPSEPVMRAVQALARHYPRIVDLPPAEVKATWSDRHCDCVIRIPSPCEAHPAEGTANAEHRARSRSQARSVPCIGPARLRAGTKHWGLSPREAQVFGLVVNGKQNKEVASLLGLSIKTVEKHLSNVMAKAGVHSRTELISALL